METNQQRKSFIDIVSLINKPIIHRNILQQSSAGCTYLLRIFIKYPQVCQSFLWKIKISLRLIQIWIKIW